MKRYEIKLFNDTNKTLPKSIYYIERKNVIGVGNHIKTMKSVNPELEFEYKEV